MFVLIRLLNIHPIRHSSRTREFFTNLKKYYRSTTFNLLMASNSRTCFIFDKNESTKILIQTVYEIPSTQIRCQFNLLRPTDESVSQTMHRLTANIERALIKENKSNKCRQKQTTDARSDNEKQTILVQLLDSTNQPIGENQTNKQAWINCKKLLINVQSYNVKYNAPAVIKFRFPDIIMTNTITPTLVELDYGDSEHSLFDWYVTNDIKTEENDDNTEWTHVHRGSFCIFRDEHINKFVRLAC
ncbi:unnamed protein product [Rotaria magnacalcarata]|uniref:Uncharacterized protein n=1 Tax=Rotaria magnacalcarata TaxID=392030 RepID=A0A815JV98_9BILA|nr:unnamed protein product [Rotaria magnacalcarata]CAF1384888.1 unnamed protein product [Rotaria magnacalcarata]CAF1998973.1 unnamed protein product [Rotaria magnacalcarata]CAF2032145.1 unnamed protein product [Rotaria magnacalcarata]CAF2036647.1 unnamed protein product [Rotaria magnacalcarata]